MTANITYFDSDGASQVTTVTLADAYAGITQRAKKLGYRSVSDRVLLNIQEALEAITGNDGIDQIRIALDTGTLFAPYGVAAVLSAAGAGGVWASTGTRGYRLSAINANGETFVSAEITINVDDVTKKVTLSWTQVTGATGYRLYRTDTPGTYGASSLRSAIAGGATVTFVDDGTATITGTLPTTNTTGGWTLFGVLSGAGAGGVWGSTGLRYWRVVAVDSAGAEIANSLELSVNVDDITKKVTLSWAAVTGAVTYKLYRSTVSGTYTSPALVTNVTAPTVTYDDTGTATTTGGLATTPTYGIPPATFTVGPWAVGTVAIGLEIYFWIKLIVPLGTPETGNPRLALVTTKET